MALIYYTPHPLKVAETISQEFPEGTTYAEIINTLDATNRELNINVNGIVPDDIKLTDKVSKYDVVYIRTLVLGGSSRESNKTADIITVVALVAATAATAGGASPFLVAGIGLTGGIASGALRARAAKQAAAESGSGSGVQGEPSLQIFNASRAENDLTLNTPIPLVMGEHRMSPPYGAMPYWDYSTIVDSAINTGIAKFDGVNTDVTHYFVGHVFVDIADTAFSWTAITVTISATNYNVRVPLGAYNAVGGTPASVTAYIAGLLANGANNMFAFNITAGNYAPNTDHVKHEFILYFDSGIYNGQYMTDWSLITTFSAGQLPALQTTINNQFARPELVYTGSDKDKLLVPCFFQNDISQYKTAMTPSATAFYLNVRFRSDFYTRKELGSNTQVIYHLFNYGYGDLTISEDQIGDSPLPTKNISKKSNLINTTWKFLNSSLIGDTFFPQGANTSYPNVLQIEGAQLKNPVSTYPRWSIIGTDQTSYNWLTRTTPDNTVQCCFNLEITSSVYVELENSYESRPIFLQFQYRPFGSTTWLPMQHTEIEGSNFGLAGGRGIFTISGDGVFTWQNQLRTVDNSYLSIMYVFPSSGKYDIRCRKMSSEMDHTIDPIYEDTYTISAVLQTMNFYIDYEADDYVGQNRTSIVVKASQEFNGTINRFNSLVKAKTYKYSGAGDVYTWDFTSNPADWFLYMVRGCFKNSTTHPDWPTGLSFNADAVGNGERLFGAGISDSKIDFDSIKSWWNFCDTKQLEFNAVLSTANNVFDVLNEIAACGRASISFSTGKIGVIFENPNQLPVAMFGMDNIIKNSFSIQYISEQAPDAIAVSYVDKDNNYSENEVMALSEGVTDPINIETIKIWGVTNETQAQKEANLIVSRNRYQKRTISFEADVEGLILTRGDIILLQHDITQWSFSFRAKSLISDGTNVTQIETGCNLPTSLTHILIRKIDGSMQSSAVSVSGGMVILSEPFNLTSAPYYLDDQQTINTLSSVVNSVPEDLMIFAGFSNMPAKKVRIIDISYTSINRMKITCVDEEAAIYARELDNLPSPISYEDFEDYTFIEAVVKNIGYEDLGNGVAKVYWQIEGALAVTGTISVNGSVPSPLIVSGSQTIFSDEIYIDYAISDVINIVITPIVIGVPYTTQSQSIGFTLG